MTAEVAVQHGETYIQTGRSENIISDYISRQDALNEMAEADIRG